MDDFLQSEPFIVIESKVYFEWLSLRLQALKRVQLRMAHLGPSNFGISTCIVMHLMRHTVHSPISDKPWLTTALRELRFEETMETFGMFFLHDLDTDLWCIGEIEANDPEPCKKYFSQAKKKSKELHKFETKVPQPPNTEATPEYPCGETPDYSTWQRTLLNSEDPASLVTRWTMEENFNDSVGSLAINLFMAFTADLIHAITLDYLKGGYPDYPESLEEAMAFWTVETLGEFLHYPEFISTSWRLKGTLMGPRDRDPQHLDIFFPEDDNALRDSGWDAVLRWGYLKSFFAGKKRMPKDDFIDLRHDLGRIVNRLQCLPVAIVPKGRYRGSIWMEGKKGFQIWVNPNHYRLKKTVVVKGGNRSRKKKGLKSIPQQAKDFGDLRGLAKEKPHGHSGKTKKTKAKIVKHLDIDDNLGMDGDDDDDDDDDNANPDESYKNALKFCSSRKARKKAGSDTDSDEEYLPSTKTLQTRSMANASEDLNKEPTGMTKARDRRSGRTKNKRVPPKKPETTKQLYSERSTGSFDFAKYIAEYPRH